MRLLKLSAILLLGWLLGGPVDAGMLLSAAPAGGGGGPTMNTPPAVSPTTGIALSTGLTTTNGTWTPSAGTTYAYQWKNDGANIPSATASTYTVAATDLGHTLTAVVTATNAGSSNSATSNPVSVYGGLLDIVTSGVKYCWSLRACSNSLAVGGTAHVITLARNDGRTCDYKLSASGSGAIDLTQGLSCSTTTDNGTNSAQATWCAASPPCHVSLWYDQTGGGNHLHEATTTFAREPAFVAPGGCGTGFGSGVPCMQYTGTQSASTNTDTNLMVGSQTSMAQSIAGVFVYQGTWGPSSYATITGGTASWGLTIDSAGTLDLYAGTVVTIPSVTNAAWHTVTAMWNAASSAINVDGTDYSPVPSPGNPGTGTNGTAIALGGSQVGSQGMNGYFAEGAFWTATTLTSTQRGNLCHNARVYWGIAGTC